MSSIDLRDIGTDFTDFGVDSNLENLKDEIRSRGLWDDFAEADSGEAFLEALAFALARTNYKLFRLAQESYPTLAQQRQSVLEGFKAIGYNANRRQWSTVGLFFWLDSSSSEDVVIPAKTEITHGDSSTKLFTQQSAIIPSGQPTSSQNLQSDASSGQSVTVDVQDASVYDVNDVVEISDSNNSELKPILDKDDNNNTITLNLDNSYTTANNAQVLEKPSVLIDCAQGTIQQKQVTSQGNENLSIHISSDIVAENGVEVYVNPSGNIDPDDQWTEVDTLLEATQGSDKFQGFEVEVRPDETIDIIFGNGQLGAIPPSGDIVTVRYIETQGADGTVFENDGINTINNTIQDVTGSNVTDINVSNYDNDLTGGSDVDSIERIKVEAPDQATTGDRAVARQDYVALAQSYPSVLLANAVGERDVNPPNPDYSNVIDVYIVREADDTGNPQPLTDDFKYGTSAGAGVGNPDDDSFLGFLDRKDVLGVANSVKEADLIHFYINTDVFIDASTSPSDTRSQVKSTLNDFLLAENNVDLNIGNAVRESDIIDRIEALNRVLYSHTKTVVFAKGSVNSTSKTFNLGDFTVSNVDYALKPPFQRRTIEIYAPNGDKIAEDDGNGSLNPTANAVDFTGGSVDYTIPNVGDWELTVNFSSNPNKVFRFDFQTDDPRSGENQRDNDIFVDNNQYPLYIPSQSNISAVFD